MKEDASHGVTRDPVCLADLNPRKAAAMAEHRGRAYYFCSGGCKKTFIAQPGIFLDEVPAMRLALGVMGSAGDDHPETVKGQVRTLGQVIGRRPLRDAGRIRHRL